MADVKPISFGRAVAGEYNGFKPSARNRKRESGKGEGYERRANEVDEARAKQVEGETHQAIFWPLIKGMTAS